MTIKIPKEESSYQPTVVAADNCGWPRVSWMLGLHPAVGEEVRVTPEYATLPVLLGL